MRNSAHFVRCITAFQSNRVPGLPKRNFVPVGHFDSRIPIDEPARGSPLPLFVLLIPSAVVGNLTGSRT